MASPVPAPAPGPVVVESPTPEILSARTELARLQEASGRAAEAYNSAVENEAQAKQDAAQARWKSARSARHAETVQESLESYAAGTYRQGGADAAGFQELDAVMSSEDITQGARQVEVLRFVGEKKTFTLQEAQQSRLAALQAKDAATEAETLARETAAETLRAREDVETKSVATATLLAQLETDQAKKEREEREARIAEEARLAFLAEQARLAALEVQRQAALQAEEAVESARQSAAESARQGAAQRAAAEQSVAAPVAAPGAPAASSGGAPAPAAPAARPGTPALPPVAGPTAAANKALETAFAQMGKPYQWGGNGPGSFDCSGLTSLAWKSAGVSLPRVSRDQYAAFPKVSRADLQPGDLVFFGSPIYHVGIYTGNNKMIHAPSSGDVVKVSELWSYDYAGAVRPG